MRLGASVDVIEASCSRAPAQVARSEKWVVKWDRKALKLGGDCRRGAPSRDVRAPLL